MDDEPFYPYCHDLDKYEKLNSLGVGTFGEVYRGKCISTGEFVALKKFKIEHSSHGVPISTLREIKLLSVLKHENIISLIEVCRKMVKVDDISVTEFYMVLELCEVDLLKILTIKTIKISLSLKKTIMKMLLKGVSFMHSNKIIHRDIKASNILINSKGIIKLADFGLARPLFGNDSLDSSGRKRQYSSNVVTLWYRAPELLLGDRHYGAAIDMWSIGCVMMELWLRKAFLPGDTEIQQLQEIFNLCGSLTPRNYPGLEKLEVYRNLNLPKTMYNKYEERINGVVGDKFAYELALRLLTPYPGTRIDSNQALKHKFFTESPIPDENLTSLITALEAHRETEAKNAQIAQQKAIAAKKPETTCMFPTRIY